jgi:hypothetical protein
MIKMSNTDLPKKGSPSIFFAVILIILAMSIIAFYQAFNAYLLNNTREGNYLVLIGLSTLALSGYMFFQTRRRKTQLIFKPFRVSTTVTCEKCGFKNIRGFRRGDYILNDAGSCPSCNEKMIITEIYREPEKSRK